MSLFDWLQITLFVGLLFLCTPLLGSYMAYIFKAHQLVPIPILNKFESVSYRLANIDPMEEMDGWIYGKSMLLFNTIGLLAVFILQLIQHVLPLNPQGIPSVSPLLAFNTAASFTTNTNWQSYAGEVTLSYLTQMLGLTVQNFLSAATGSAVLLALIRGLTRQSTNKLGNFWVDLIRTVIYILLPLSLLLALFLVGQGVVQTLSPYIEAVTLEHQAQTVPLGPVASQVAIKQLGTNGGGFFRANSAHPFENPTPLSNFLEVFAIILIPAATTYMYGVMIKSKRQGWIFFFVMLILWGAGLGIALYSEYLINPVLGIGPVLEGKETRIGVATVFYGLSPQQQPLVDL